MEVASGLDKVEQIVTLGEGMRDFQEPGGALQRNEPLDNATGEGVGAEPPRKAFPGLQVPVIDSGGTRAQSRVQGQDGPEAAEVMQALKCFHPVALISPKRGAGNPLFDSRVGPCRRHTQDRRAAGRRVYR